MVAALNRGPTASAWDPKGSLPDKTFAGASGLSRSTEGVGSILAQQPCPDMSFSGSPTGSTSYSGLLFEVNLSASHLAPCTQTLRSPGSFQEFDSHMLSIQECESHGFQLRPLCLRADCGRLKILNLFIKQSFRFSFFLVSLFSFLSSNLLMPKLCNADVALCSLYQTSDYIILIGFIFINI